MEDYYRLVKDIIAVNPPVPESLGKRIRRWIGEKLYPRKGKERRSINQPPRKRRRFSLWPRRRN